MPKEIVRYAELLGLIKQRIRQGQTKTVLSANAELSSMYWDIGRMLHQRQQQKGWGAAVIPRLSRDLRNELPVTKGFSERNIGRMIAFYRAYPTLGALLPQPVAKTERLEMIQDIATVIRWGPIIEKQRKSGVSHDRTHSSSAKAHPHQGSTLRTIR